MTKIKKFSCVIIFLIFDFLKNLIKKKYFENFFFFTNIIMSNISLMSNDNSSLFNSVKNGTNGVNLEHFIYNIEKPFPNSFRSRENKTQILGVAPNGTFQVPISSFGLWRNSYLKWSISYQAGTNCVSPTIASALGAHLISSVKILSNSRCLAELTSAQIQFLVYGEKDVAKREGMKKAMRNIIKDDWVSNASATSGGSQTPNAVATIFATDAQTLQTKEVYTPLPFSFFQNAKCNLPLDFTERIVLEITTRPTFQVLVGGDATGFASGTAVAADRMATPLTINSCHLCNEYLIMDADSKKAIQSKNYSLGSSPLSILCDDFKTKSVVATADSDLTTASVNLFFTENAMGCLFYVERTAEEGGLREISDAHKANATPNTALRPLDRSIKTGSKHEHKRGKYLHINSIKLTAGGKVLYEGTHDEIRNLNGSNPMGHNVNGDVETAMEEDTAGSSEYNLYYVNFSNSHLSETIKTCLALRNLNSVVAEITFPSVSGKKYNCVANLRHYVAYSIDGASGAISTALSN